MRYEVISGDKLYRERWEFNLLVDYGLAHIRLSSYHHESKESTRKRKWTTIDRWASNDKRASTIQNPPLPEYVVAEVKEYFSREVAKLPIKT